MGRIRRSWILTKKSWHVLRQNRTLLLFPVLALLCGLGALIVLIAPAAALAAAHAPDGAYVPLAIVAVYLFTFFTVFFNVALAGAVTKDFNGEPATIGDGIAVARQRVGAIAVWALISTTVGVALRALEDRMPLAGQIAVTLVGVAWAVVTFFVVPVLALEGVGAGAAIKRSATIFKQRWGEQFTGQIAIGGAMFLIALPVVGLIVVGVAAAASGIVVLGVLLVAIGVVAMGFLVIATSAMTQIFGVALYRYATEGGSSGPFSEAELEGAFAPKRRRRGGVATP